MLDISNLLAAPMATMFMADFGADVIKVEHPVHGDELRKWGRRKDDVGLYFKVLNRNKRTITLDLKTPRGQALVHRLVAECDVVVESYRPGTIERWGLGYEQLSEVNPRLIMLHISGFGRTGPASDKPGFGTIGEAFSGYAAITGFPDRPPLLPAFGLGDASTGIFAAFAVLLALYHRDARGGTGQEIDLGLYEGLFTMLGPQVIDYDQLGVVQERAGSRLPFVAPRNTFETADGAWIAIAGSTQATFERIADVLGCERLISDARFADNQARMRNAAALEAELQEAIRRVPAREILERCSEMGAPVGPVYDIAQIFDDPQYRARENIAVVPDDELGEVRMQNVVPRLTDTPGRIEHAGPPKGSHNSEVYGGLLGLAEDELAVLEDAGVI